MRRQPFLPAPRTLCRVAASWIVALAVALALTACQQPRVASRADGVQGTSPPQPVVVTPPPSEVVAQPEPSLAPLPPLVSLPETPASPGGDADAPPAASLEPTLPPGPVSVALLLPLTGPSGALGAAMLDAAQLALFDIDADQFVLLPVDTEGTPDGAARAAATALEGGASLILGPLFSGSVTAVAPLVRERGVNVIAFSSDRTAAGPGVFVMGLLPGQQVERVVGFASTQGYSRFAALTPASHYGQTVVQELRRVTQAMAAELVDVVFFPANVKAASEVSDIVRIFTNYDARRQRLLDRKAGLAERDDEVSRKALRRLEGLETLGDVGFDAVLVPEGGLRLLTVAPLLPYYDLDPKKVRLLGTAQWETAALDQEPALIGGWFAAPPPETRAAFESRFAEIYGHPPPRLATLAYDAVALAGALAQLADGPDFSTTMLTNPGGFRGVDGLFRFDADGTNERGLAVLEVTEDGVTTVDAAPRSFAVF